MKARKNWLKFMGIYKSASVKIDKRRVDESARKMSTE